MKYRILGKSGLLVSELSFGTMTFGTTKKSVLKVNLDTSSSKHLVDLAIDHGVNLFDTANLYSAGESEIILGESLKNKRHDVLICTKAGFPTDQNNVLSRGLNKRHLIEQVEKSLKRLQTDYIDLFVCHIADLWTPIETIASALQWLVDKGWVRYLGVSNFSAWQIQKLQDYLGDSYPLVVAQMHYSLLNRDIEVSVLPCLHENNIALMVWGPLSSGFLTGAYSRENPNPKGKRRVEFDMPVIRDKDLAYDVVDVLKDMAKSHNTSIASIAIAWLLEKKNDLLMGRYAHLYNVGTILVGANSENQFKENIKASTIILSKEEMETLNNMTKPILPYPEDFIDFFDISKTLNQ